MPAANTSGSAPGRSVRLAARGGEVPAAIAVAHRRGAEALVRHARAARDQPRRERVDVALDDDVELARLAAEQQVAHGAADEVHALHARGRVEQPPAARQLPQAFAQVVHGNSLALAADRGRPADATRAASTIAGVIFSPRGERPASAARDRGRASRTRCRRRARGVRRHRQRVQLGRRVRRHERGQALRARAARPSKRPSGRRRLPVAQLRLHEGAHALPARAQDAAAALPPGLGRARQRPARVLARAVRPAAVPAEEQRRAVRDLAHDRQGELEAQARRARRGVAGLQPRDGVRRPAQALARDGGRPGGRGLARARGARAGRASCPAGRSPRRCIDRGRVFLGTRGRDGVLAARQRRRRALEGAGGRRGEGRARARRRQALLRRLRRQGPRDPPLERLEGLGDVADRRRRSASATATSTPRRRSSTAASTSAARTATSTRSPARDGKLAWRHRTGGFVYASPAVGQVRGGKPTVYIGSYDGRFYALDARTGNPRWIRSLGQKISGAATVIGDIVFVSDLDNRTTWALGARTGKTVWKTNRGGFHPAISDGRRIYFTAYSSLFALDPRGRPFAGRASAGERRVGARAGGGGTPARERSPRRREAARRAARPRAARAPAALPLPPARTSPQRERRLRAQLPPPPPRLPAARHDDRPAPQPLPLAPARALSRAPAGYRRTAMPDAARCSFASRMRNVP